MKDGDLYSYATIDIASHGFNIKTNEDFMYEIKVSPVSEFEAKAGLLPYVELQIGTNDYGSMNLRVQPEDIDRVIRDKRSQSFDSFIMVYRAGPKSKEEIIDLIRRQLADILILRKGAYEILVKNAGEMIETLLGWPRIEEGSYLCSTAPNYEGKRK